MSPDYWVWCVKQLTEAVPLRATTARERPRPYELMVRQTDQVLNHFANAHGMCTLMEDNR